MLLVTDDNCIERSSSGWCFAESAVQSHDLAIRALVVAIVENGGAL